MKLLSDVGEDALIAALIAHMPQFDAKSAQPGDDCAVLSQADFTLTDLLLKTDAMIEGIHFTQEMPARAIGWKAIARVSSDFAAMGGQPNSFMVTVALPASTSLAWIEEVYQGMADCMHAFGGKLVGGETSRMPLGAPCVFSISALGTVPENRAMLRSTAKPDDVIFVTGKLGGSFAGKHLSFSPRIEHGRWLLDHFRVTAMMDLSDGIAKDLPRMAQASDCGFQLDLTAIPLTTGCGLNEALHDGEDYELLLAVAPSDAGNLLEVWGVRFPELPLTRIGHFVKAGSGDVLSGGWDHFPAV